ncbi:MAG: glycosyltransferase [Acidobacteria bacterium]|nr:glycosyltransferase [Acidobacteriota bacterium]
MAWRTCLWIAGSLVAWAWVSRLVEAAMGMRTVADISRPEWDLSPADQALVTIIVPARNEEADIERTLTSLLCLDYENYQIIAVDDRSTDSTGRIIEELARSQSGAATRGRLSVLHVDRLPPGWLGKTHAMWAAAQQARGDWLLFTDADVCFQPDSLRRALAYTEREPADHLVVLPRIIMKTPGERMMVAFFQTLFLFGHRPWKVADPRAEDHMGVGAFNLLRRSSYEAVGSYKRLRMEVLDDMKLGKVVKKAGFRQRNVFGGDLISVYWVRGTLGMVANLSKNLFAILSFEWPRTMLTCLTLAFLNLWPFAGFGLASGVARIPYAIALLALALLYVGMSTKSPIPPYYFFLHPISSTLFIYALLQSAVLTLVRDGIIWRGTKYALAELRRGKV